MVERDLSFVPGVDKQHAYSGPSPGQTPRCLVDFFEVGVWSHHLENQSNRSSPVQGVRFFFATDAAEVADTAENRLLGKFGYICVLPASGRVSQEGNLQVSLESLKTVLLGGKAWEANEKAACLLHGKLCPVIFMTTGRPKDRRFGGQDCLFGLFQVGLEAKSTLSCTLTPRPCAAVTLEEMQTLLRSRLQAPLQKGSKRRRRDIAVYSCAGGLMGPPADVALTGAHCKDLWIHGIQGAAASISVNAYCIGDHDILEELRKASCPPRRVNVRIRYDMRQQSKTIPSVFEEEKYRYTLVHPVIVSEDDRALMHKKELIVDAGNEGALVLIGSYNPTCNARGNQESAVRLTDPGVVKLFSDRFDADWNHEIANHSREQPALHTPSSRSSDD